MQGIEEDFMLNDKAVPGRLISCHGGADQDFAIGKRDDVRLRLVPEKIGVNLRHRGSIDQDDLDDSEMRGQMAGQKRKRRLKLPQKRTDPHWHFVLLV